MKVRDDIDPEKTWVVSDTHWGHDNIVGFCDRPAAHHDVMIQRWNEEVPWDATVLHLGDICYKSNALFKHVISPKLRGERKLLIQGNHDKQRYAFYRDSGFKVIPEFEMTWRGLFTVSFSHYPLRAADPRRNHVHVHGHIHNNGYGGTGYAYVPFARGQINVSVEQTHYRPVNLAALLRGHFEGCYPPSGDGLLRRPSKT